jgi:hypothetical protein
MTADPIICGSCSATHDRRLFHLHNHLIDRPMLGYEALGLQFIGTSLCPVDRSRLICRFRVVKISAQHVGSTSKASKFEGIEFSPVALAT